MPANIEIKAELRDVHAAHAKARILTGRAPQVLHQTDIFFNCPNGRLKLRISDAASDATARGELILYQRPDAGGPRRSNYVIAKTSDPHILRDILEQVLESAGTVKKVRSLYLAGQTRIHLDQVEGLGDFLEFEVVLKPGQADAEGTQIAQALMGEFGVQPADLIQVAYVDLLRRRPGLHKNLPTLG